MCYPLDLKIALPPLFRSTPRPNSSSLITHPKLFIPSSRLSHLPVTTPVHHHVLPPALHVLIPPPLIYAPVALLFASRLHCLPLPPYHTHPTFLTNHSSRIALGELLGCASKLLRSSLFSSPVVSCILLAPLFSRSSCVENLRHPSLLLYFYLFPLLSHVCANTLPHYPLYSRRNFFLCTLSSFFQPVVHCPYLASFSLSFRCVIFLNSSFEPFRVHSLGRSYQF